MWKINISSVAQWGRKPQKEEKVAAVPRSPSVFMPPISSTLKPVGIVSERRWGEEIRKRKTQQNHRQKKKKKKQREK